MAMIHKWKANTFETNAKQKCSAKKNKLLKKGYLVILKNIIMELKNSQEGPNSRTDISEERVNEPEGRSTEIIQSKQEKMRRITESYETIIKKKIQYSCYIRFRRRETDADKYLKK